MCNIPHNLRRVKVVAAMKKTIDMDTQKCYKTKNTPSQNQPVEASQEDRRTNQTKNLIIS